MNFVKNNKIKFIYHVLSEQLNPLADGIIIITPLAIISLIFLNLIF